MIYKVIRDCLYLNFNMVKWLVVTNKVTICCVFFFISRLFGLLIKIWFFLSVSFLFFVSFVVCMYLLIYFKKN